MSSLKVRHQQLGHTYSTHDRHLIISRSSAPQLLRSPRRLYDIDDDIEDDIWRLLPDLDFPLLWDLDDFPLLWDLDDFLDDFKDFDLADFELE